MKLAPLIAAVTAASAAAAAAAQPLRVCAFAARPFYQEAGAAAGLEHDLLSRYAAAVGSSLAVRWVEDFDLLLPLVRERECDCEESLRTVPGARLVYGDSERALFAAVASGRAAALACDSALVLPLLGEFPGLGIGIALSDRSHYAFALPRGSPHRAGLDDAIATAQRDGSYRRMLERHFGEENARYILGSERD